MSDITGGKSFDPWPVAEALGLTVVERHLRGGRWGEYWHAERTILLTKGMTWREARATLTHEIQHALAGDVFSKHGAANIKPERRARIRTAEVLVDPVEYAEAERIRDGHLPSIAFDLDVANHVIDDWLWLQRTKILAG
jgi:Zn-dependent peptidase ImmA (M78 family)